MAAVIVCDDNGAAFSAIAIRLGNGVALSGAHCGIRDCLVVDLGAMVDALAAICCGVFGAWPVSPVSGASDVARNGLRLDTGESEMGNTAVERDDEFDVCGLLSRIGVLNNDGANGVESDCVTGFGSVLVIEPSL